MKDNKKKEAVLEFIKSNAGTTIEAIVTGTKTVGDINVRTAIKELQAEKLIETNPDDGTYSFKNKGKTVVPVAEQKNEAKKADAKPEKKKAEDDMGPKTVAGSRDNTRYRLGEARNLPKGRLVHLLIKTFVQKTPNVTLGKLNEIFHSEELQPRFHIAMEHTESRKKFSKGKIDRHFLATEMLIKLADKKSYAICNQWDAIRINKLLKIVAAPPINLRVKAEVSE